MKAAYVERAHATTARLCFCATIAVMLLCSGTYGQTVEQAFTLRAGWNVIYVEVDPQPPVLDELLDGTAIKSVWVRKEDRRASAGNECADGPGSANCLTSTDTGWRVWFSADQPQSAIGSLRSMIGGRAYMIEASERTRLTLRGKPNPSVTRWRKGFNLGGFHVVDRVDSTPTFEQYLSASRSHQNTNVYEVNADGSLARVGDMSKSKIAPGRGYWVESSQNTVYDGPIRIDARSLRGVDLTAGTTERYMEIENLAGSAGSVLVSDARPQETGASADPGGRVPLLWYDYAGGAVPKWRKLESVKLNLGSRGLTGSKRTLRVGVQRLETNEVEADKSVRRTSLLAVTDESGYRRLIPVSNQGTSQSGLWIGDVTINEVAWKTSSPTVPTPTSSEFVFRIIVHHSVAETRLLREAIQIFDDLTQSYVLVTPSCFDRLDSTQASPRVSSANFSFPDSVVLAGTFPTVLTTSITTAAIDSLNPFFHPFNPIHDEGFETTRNITLTFDTDGGGDPQWGVTKLGGVYEERIMGLHREEIKARGRFELRRVSYVGTLCGT